MGSLCPRPISPFFLYPVWQLFWRCAATTSKILWYCNHFTIRPYQFNGHLTQKTVKDDDATSLKNLIFGWVAPNVLIYRHGLHMVVRFIAKLYSQLGFGYHIPGGIDPLAFRKLYRPLIDQPIRRCQVSTKLPQKRAQHTSSHQAYRQSSKAHSRIRAGPPRIVCLCFTL